MPLVRWIRTGNGHNAGEIIECDDRAAAILTAPDALGGQMATLVRGMDYETRVIEPEPAPVAEDPPPRKGRYMRRDMRAKE